MAPELRTPEEYTFAPYSIAGNLTLYAQWTPNTGIAYNVRHYLVNSKGRATLKYTENLKGTTGAAVKATVKTYTGYTHNFSHSETKLTGTIAADGSLVLKVYYEIKTSTVTFEDYDGKILKKQTVEYRADATAPSNPSRSGYTFEGWNKASSAWKNVNSNVTIVAKYSKNTSGTTVSTSDSAGGSGSNGATGSIGISGSAANSGSNTATGVAANSVATDTPLSGGATKIVSGGLGGATNSGSNDGALNGRTEPRTGTNVEILDTKDNPLEFSGGVVGVPENDTKNNHLLRAILPSIGATLAVAVILTALGLYLRRRKRVAVD